MYASVGEMLLVPRDTTTTPPAPPPPPPVAGASDVKNLSTAITPAGNPGGTKIPTTDARSDVGVKAAPVDAGVEDIQTIAHPGGAANNVEAVGKGDEDPKDGNKGKATKPQVSGRGGGVLVQALYEVGRHMI